MHLELVIIPLLIAIIAFILTLHLYRQKHYMLMIFPAISTLCLVGFVIVASYSAKAEYDLEEYELDLHDDR